MTTSDAWLLDCGDSLRIAVGDREMIELIRDQSCYPVPGTPDYCASVVAWQGRIVPVMDLARLHDAAAVRRHSSAYLCLLYYQSAPGQPVQPVAIRVTDAPERIRVDDAQVCELPEKFADSRLRAVTLCCFEQAGEGVLILDIASLCSAEFRDFATAA